MQRGLAPSQGLTWFPENGLNTIMFTIHPKTLGKVMGRGLLFTPPEKKHIPPNNGGPLDMVPFFGDIRSFLGV